MTYTIITTNIISTTHAALAVTTNENLEILPNVDVVGDDGFDGIYLSGTNLDGSIAVDGLVAGKNAIWLQYAVGDETISVGSAGSVTGQDDAIYMKSSSNPGINYIDNSGYIYGVNNGLDLYDNGMQIDNSAHIGGNTAINLHAAKYDTILNEAGGVVSGQIGAIVGSGASTFVDNAGTVSSTNDVSQAISLFDDHETVISSGVVQGGVAFGGGESEVQNSGVITGETAVLFDDDTNTLINSGKIVGSSDAVLETGTSSGFQTFINEQGGLIEGEINDANGEAHIVNHGALTGEIFVAGASTYLNTGVATGEAEFIGSGVVVRNFGVMTFDGGAGGSATLLIDGAAGSDDRIVNATGGAIDATNGIAVWHLGSGTVKLVNQGTISGDVDLDAPATLVNTGSILGDVTLGGSSSTVVNDGLIDGDLTLSVNGNNYFGQNGQVTGDIVGSGVGGRYIGGAGADTFDLSGAVAQYVGGGAGDDTFLFTPLSLTAKTTVVGGDGIDTITFTAQGAITAASLAHVSSVEVFNLGGNANSIALTDALVASAQGGAVTVNGAAGVDTINAAAVASATSTVIMDGGGGGDQLIAGAAKVVFDYNSVHDSTGTAYDTVTGANLALDSFDVSAVAGSVAAVNPAVTAGSLSTSTFNADLAAALPAAKLGAHDAVLFTPNAGTLAGDTFLVVDVNGVAGYQANADLVLRLAGATGTLTTANFV